MGEGRGIVMIGLLIRLIRELVSACQQEKGSESYIQLKTFQLKQKDASRRRHVLHHEEQIDIN